MRVVYSATVTEPDRRYRVMVLLNRSDRPTNWKFKCPNCNMPLADLVNRDVVAISDTIDYDSRGLIGIRCDGRTGHGRCSIWYYFATEAD